MYSPHFITLRHCILPVIDEPLFEGAHCAGNPIGGPTFVRDAPNYADQMISQLQTL